jgi:voltage-gated potassium channel Kch
MTTEEQGAVEETLMEELGGELPDRIPIRERYGLVLALVFLAYLLGGIEDERLVILLNTIIWATVLLATLWSPGLPRALRRIGIGATVIFFVSAASIWVVSTDVSNGWRLLILAVAQFAALLAILARISQHRVVTIQTVMGGIAAYALIAFVMAAVYRAIELVTGDTFLNGVGVSGDYLYFSFVTLTTVGYGDITPATDLAKRLAVIEMFVGQVFLITLVARLVSLWKTPEPRRFNRT